MKYAELTGIEKTRLFRLFNGAEMKLKEFEILQSFIIEENGESVNWRRIISDHDLDKQNCGNSLKKGYSVLMERSERLQSFVSKLESAA